MIDGTIERRYSAGPDVQTVEVPFWNRATRKRGVRVYSVCGERRILMSELVDPEPLPLDLDDEILIIMAEHGIDVTEDMRKDVEAWPLPKRSANR